jgi:hypothetical protein
MCFESVSCGKRVEYYCLGALDGLKCSKSSTVRKCCGHTYEAETFTPDNFLDMRVKGSLSSYCTSSTDLPPLLRV